MMENEILLVEDNEDDIILTLRAFKKYKIANKVVVAKDGKEALDLLFAKDHPLKPALIILDLKLPKVSGLEVLEEIYRSDQVKNYPVVVLTTSNEEDDMVRSYELGAKSYLRKPIKFEEFAEAIGHLGMCWLVLNEPGPGQ